jgi:hypothetical protein
MKTVMIVLSLLAMFACNDKKKEPVDQTRTTSAIVVEPTLHDGHAVEPKVSPSSEEEELNNIDMDVDDVDMSGTRDGGN